MNLDKLISESIAKIHNQRFLFGTVGILVVAGVSPFEIIASVMILAAVVVIISLDLWAAKRVGPAQLGMTLALEFSQSEALDNIQLESANCRVFSPLSPAEAMTHRLMPYRDGGGQGWLCPIPNGVSPGDVMEFTFTDSEGSTWVSDPTVPQLLYPKIEVHRTVGDDE